jgi:hypothetical protein
MATVAAARNTGVLHGPELPHHGTPHEDRDGRRIINCKLRDWDGRVCDAVVTGLPHDWHAPGCPLYANTCASAA